MTSTDDGEPRRDRSPRRRRSLASGVWPGVALALGLLALGHGTGAAQETGEPGVPPALTQPVDPESAPRPSATAAAAAGPIRIDGALDEPSWERAERITGFIQSQPSAGYPATEPTVVRILYDERALYIGAVNYDSNPDALTVRTLERDFPGESTRDADILGVTLDTFLDRRSSFIFLVNPLGGYRDGQTTNDSRNTDFGWDGVFQVRTRIHEEGWTVEMAIPWSTLRFDPGVDRQVWGLNILRRVRRKNEDSYWAPVDRRDPVHRMSQAGTLVLGEMGELRSGRNLRIKPYALARRSPGGISEETAAGGAVDGGIDLKYGLTSELTLDFTVNTDFSQVEVDEEQVNLTRFPLFFPEKRDFFLENSGSFTFGDVTERNYRQGASLRDFTLFHSRRIGLTADGRPIPILTGGRVSGRAGGFELGLLNMQTQGLGEAAPENFSVARLRRNLFAGSDIGAMFINRQATDGGGHNRAFGFDANLRLLRSLIVNSYLAGTADSERGGTGLAGRVSAAWRDRFWNISAMYKSVDQDFEPEVGFIRRRGIRHTYATAGAHPRPALPWLFEINPYVELDYITDPGGSLLTRLRTMGAGFDLLAAGTLDLTLTDRFERIDDPFQVSGGATVPVGDYDFTEAELRYQSNRGRPLSGQVQVTRGGFFGGDRTSLSLAADWRPSPHLAVQVNAGHNVIDLPAGSFTADVFGGKVGWALNTRLFTSAFVQYNEALDELVTNLRFNWIHAPLSDLFVVLTERRHLGGRGALDRMLTLKATRLLAF